MSDTINTTKESAISLRIPSKIVIVLGLQGVNKRQGEIIQMICNKNVI